MVDVEGVVGRAPNQPGVYVFRDGEGAPLYVGKASSLKGRLSNYLRKSDLDAKTRVLLENTLSLDFTVTDTESEALLLEYNLIKEYRPKFNVRYRDDKRYPYIKLTNEGYPRILVTRKKEADGARYFGPYPDGTHVRKILRMMSQLFRLRTCRGDPLEQKPCLSFHIKRCVGPCTGKVSEGEYEDLVEEACLFLKGETEELVRKLSDRMREYSDSMEFEKAAYVRDKLSCIKGLSEEKKIVAEDAVNRDYIGYAMEGDTSGISVFKERGGRVLSHLFFLLDGEYKTDEEESVGSFIRQYYQTSEIPEEIVVGVNLGEKELLSKERGGKVKIRFVRRGRLKRLLSLVAKNARIQVTSEAHGLCGLKPSEKLARILGLEEVVRRVEGYDVSTISGKLAVGSMVVFEDGRPKKTDYRRFRIKTVEGANDVAMMAEVVSRRLRNKWSKPDVILVDGGLGQVNATSRVLKEAGESIPVVGLAKEREDVYVGGRRGVLPLQGDSPVLRLLIRIRDEAHRFAVTYHRKLRGRETVSRRKS